MEDHTLSALIAALTQENTLYAELQELARGQRDALVDGDAQRMGDIVQQQQQLLRRLKQPEKARQEALEDFALSRGQTRLPGIAQVIEAASGESRAALTALRDELEGRIADLRTANELNRRLLDTQLHYLSFCLDVLTQSDQAGEFYGSSGASQEAAHRSGILDQKV